MEKHSGVFMAITYWRYGETWQSIYGDHLLETWRNMAEHLWRSHIGDMEKHGGAFMEILCWSLLRSNLELATAKWRLNRNGEIMETNCGDQNFIHYGVENTYLEHFKDRNV